MKYNIEGNINFYDELNKYKLTLHNDNNDNNDNNYFNDLNDFNDFNDLNDNNDKNSINMNNTCLITNTPLNEYHITLKCGHK
jgi:hypothetical protein